MKKTISSLLRNSFFQGGILFTFANFFVGFLNYFFNSLSAKTLGPSGYSEITTLFAYLTLLSVPILVITTEIVRRLGLHGKDKLKTLKRWETWIVNKAKRWAYLLIPYFLLGFLLPRLTNLSLFSSSILLTLLLLSFIGAFYIASLQGLHRFWSISWIIIVVGLIKLAGPLVHFPYQEQLVTILLFLVLSGTVGIVLSKIALKTDGVSSVEEKPIKNLEKRLSDVLLSKSVFITVGSLVGINVLNNLDVIFTKKFYPAFDAGIYGGWSLLAKIIFYVYGPLLSLSLIYFSSRAYRKYSQKVLLVGLLFFIVTGFFFYLTYNLFGSRLISLIFNRRYMLMLPYLSYAAIFGSLYTGIYFLNTFFLTKNSSFSLIALVGTPIYALLLFFYGKTLQAIMTIDILVAIAIFSLYLSFIFYYNMRHNGD